MSEDAQRVFGGSSAVEAKAHVPLQLGNGAKVEAGGRTNGSLCFDVTTPGRSPASVCGNSVEPDDVSGVIHGTAGQPTIYAGLAGDNVTTVDVLTDHGDVSATVQNGAFYSSIPEGSSIVGWVVTTADGSKTTHHWPPDSTDVSSTGASGSDQSN
ncbi:MAG TPA: hypothetical protein VII83_02375 [Gaiellaceae bacterium]